MFDNRIAVVTGGASGIGKVIAEQFQAAGARVCIIDVLPNDYFVGDLADQAVLEAFALASSSSCLYCSELVNSERLLYINEPRE